MALSADESPAQSGPQEAPPPALILKTWRSTMGTVVMFGVFLNEDDD